LIIRQRVKNLSHGIIVFLNWVSHYPPTLTLLDPDWL